MINTPNAPTIRSWWRTDVSIFAVHVSNLPGGGGGIDSVALDDWSVGMITMWFGD
ncbi:MAG TPA: hypothetical protein VGH29_03535 [Candidatus Binataceae bacterium]